MSDVVNGKSQEESRDHSYVNMPVFPESAQVTSFNLYMGPPFDEWISVFIFILSISLSTIWHESNLLWVMHIENYRFLYKYKYKYTRLVNKK